MFTFFQSHMLTEWTWMTGDEWTTQLTMSQSVWNCWQ